MKKTNMILILLFTLFLGITNVNAEVYTIERTKDDLGVNKNFEITDDNLNNVLNTPRVDADDKIYDFANILDDDTKNELYEDIQDFIEYTNMDMVILTTNLPYSDSQIEDYTADFYDYNDFGINFDKYSGIIIVRNTNSYNKFFNIYTFGDAQLYYPFERCENILDTIYYDIRNENYLSGFRTFIVESKKYYDYGIPYDYRNYYVDEMGYLKEKYTIPFLGAFIFSSIMTLIIMLVMIHKNKMVKKATKATIYLDESSVNYTKVEDRFVNTYTTSYTTSSSSGGSGGGGHSHSGSSGGGHGGGGGRHG